MKDYTEKGLNWEIAVDTWGFDKNLSHPLTSESVKIFIRVVEQQAVAEERERVVGVVKEMKDKNHVCESRRGWECEYATAINDLLSSLDKPLTDKERKCKECGQLTTLKEAGLKHKRCPKNMPVDSGMCWNCDEPSEGEYHEAWCFEK